MAKTVECGGKYCDKQVAANNSTQCQFCDWFYCDDHSISCPNCDEYHCTECTENCSNESCNKQMCRGCAEYDSLKWPHCDVCISDR